MQNNWDKTQREVLDFMDNYFSLLSEGNFKDCEKCIHPEYKDRYLKTNKFTEIFNVLKENLPFNNVNNEVSFLPQTVKILGSCSIVHYKLQIMSSSDDDEIETPIHKFTDVLAKENGKWFFIADHNGRDENPIFSSTHINRMRN